MPLIQHADEQRFGHGEQHHAPAALASEDANGGSEDREHDDVYELIPWGWNQIRGKWLRAEYEQPEQDPTPAARALRVGGAAVGSFRAP